MFALLCVVTGVGIVSSCNKTASTGTVDGELPVDSTTVGMIAYYPFNNSGIDMTGNGHDGLVNNITGTADRNGKANAAYYFDGSTSYISVKDAADLRLNNTDFTINVWARIDSYSPTYGSIIVNKRGTTNNSGWSYGIHGYINNVANAGQVTYQVSGGTDPFAAGGKIINTGTWYMLTTVYSYKKNTITFYVNGVLDNVVTGIPVPVSTAGAPMYIGRDNPATGAIGYFFRGAMDDMRIYGRAISNTTIQKLYTLTY